MLVEAAKARGQPDNVRAQQGHSLPGKPFRQFEQPLLAPLSTLRVEHQRRKATGQVRKAVSGGDELALGRGGRAGTAERCCGSTGCSCRQSHTGRRSSAEVAGGSVEQQWVRVQGVLDQLAQACGQQEGVEPV